ncbi:hypothetical protein JOQ06_001948, partial [Pogonophryne albipinna]
MRTLSGGGACALQRAARTGCEICWKCLENSGLRSQESPIYNRPGCKPSPHINLCSSTPAALLLPSVSTPSLPIHLLFAALLFLIFPLAPPKNILHPPIHSFLTKPSFSTTHFPSSYL